MKKILNIGSGSAELPEAFRGDGWKCVSLDNNPHTNSDVYGTLLSMRNIRGKQFDVVWCRSVLELVVPSDLNVAMKNIAAKLNPGGHAIIGITNMETMFELALSLGLDHVLYECELGPITVADQIWGFWKYKESGFTHETKHIGFTPRSLRLLCNPFFSSVTIRKKPRYMTMRGLFLEAECIK